MRSTACSLYVYLHRAAYVFSRVCAHYSVYARTRGYYGGKQTIFDDGHCNVFSYQAEKMKKINKYTVNTVRVHSLYARNTAYTDACKLRFTSERMSLKGLKSSLIIADRRHRVFARARSASNNIFIRVPTVLRVYQRQTAVGALLCCDTITLYVLKIVVTRLFFRRTCRRISTF